MPTLVDLQARLLAYRTAELKILDGQEYFVSDGVINRRLRRADLEQVRLAIKELEVQINAIDPAVTGVRRVLYLR